jgi:transposase-like protein
LLRREGLSSSNLTAWRRQRERGQLQALKDNKRGRKAKTPYPLQAENERLLQENQRLAKRLREAELMLDVQKKASEILLGVSLSRTKSDESD